MQRHDGGFVWALLVWAVAIAGAVTATADEPPAPQSPDAASPDTTRRQRLAQRDVHDNALRVHLAEGRLSEAIDSALKMLAVEREVFGDAHEETDGSLRWLAELHGLSGDFTEAERFASESTAVQTKAHGEGDWRSLRSRAAVDYVKRLRELKGEERDKLKQATAGSYRALALNQEKKPKDGIELARTGAQAYRNLLGDAYVATAERLLWQSYLESGLEKHADAAKALTQAAESYQQALGADSPDRAACLQSLGYVLRQQNQLDESSSAYRQAWEIRTRVLGADHAITQASAVQLIDAAAQEAAQLEERDELPAAQKARQVAVDVSAKLYGENDWRTVNTRGALQGSEQLASFTAEQRMRLVEARSLQQKCHELYRNRKYKEALVPGQQALAIRQEILGKEHIDTAASFNMVGLACGGSNNLPGAETNLKAAQTAWIATKGEAHPEVALAAVNLGETYEDYAKFEDAEKYVRQGLRIREQAFGAENASTIATARSLARILGKVADAQEARQDFVSAERARDEVIQLTTRTQGADSWLVTNARLALALTRQLQKCDAGQLASLVETTAQLNRANERINEKKYAEAVPLVEQAHKTRLAILGPENTMSHMSLTRLVVAYFYDGKMGEAVKRANEARDVGLRLFGPQHPQFASALENLAHLDRNQGDLVTAAAGFRQVYAIRAQSQGPQQTDTQSTAGALAGVLQQLASAAEEHHDYAVAHPLREEAVALQTATLGVNHWQTFDARWALAHIEKMAMLDEIQREYLKEASEKFLESMQLVQQQKYVAALSAAERALELRKEILGPEHRHTALAIQQVGVLTYYRGDTLRALRILVPNILTLRTSYGITSPDYAQMLVNIGNVYLAHKDVANAAEVTRQALDVNTKSLGANHEKTISNANKLLDILLATVGAHEKRSEYAAAAKIWEEIITLRIQLLGESHFQVNNDRWSLYRDQLFPTLRSDQRQRLDEAQTWLVKSSNLMESSTRAQVQQSDAAAAMQAQLSSAAVNAVMQAVKLRKQVLGDAHPWTADALESQSIAQSYAGDIKGAKASLDDAAAIRKKSQGEQHPGYVNNRKALSSIVVNAAALPFQRLSKLTPDQQKRIVERDGHNDAALRARNNDVYTEEQQLQAMLRIELEIYGETNEETCGSYERLADNANRQADAQGRRGYLAKIAEIRAKLYGAESWRAMEAKFNVMNVDLWIKMNENQRARLDQALAFPDRIQKERNKLGADRLSLKRALELAELVRKELLDLVGEDHLWYAGCLSSLAALYKENNDREDGDALELKAANILGRIYSKKHPMYQAKMNQLARRLSIDADQMQQAGNYPAAAAALKRRVEIQRLHYGVQHWRVKEAHADLVRCERLSKLPATQRQKLDDLARVMSSVDSQVLETAALEPIVEALRLCSELYGPEDPRTIDCLGALAFKNRQRGDLAQAIKVLTGKLEICRKALGKGHPQTAHTANALGSAYYARADYAQAEPLFREARENLEALGRRHDPVYAACLNNLAVLYEALGDYDRAESLLRTIVTMHLPGAGMMDDDADEEQLRGWASGYDSILAQFDMSAIGMEDRHLGNQANIDKKPNQNGGQGASNETPQLGPEDTFLGVPVPKVWKNSDLPKFINNLALLYQMQGNNAQAVSLLRQAIGLIHKDDASGVSDQHAAALGNLAAIYQIEGDAKQAELLFECVIDVLKAKGINDARYAMALSNLGVLRFQAGDYARVGELWREALKIRRDRLGERHPRTLLAMSNLALLAHYQGQTAQAIKQYDQVLDATAGNLQLAAAIQSERQQLILRGSFRGYLDQYLSLTDHADVPAEQVYLHALAWKGMVSARQRRMRGLRELVDAKTGDALGKLYAQLSGTNRQLAALSIEGAEATSAVEAVKQRAQLSTLALRKDELERELARQSSQFDGWLKSQRLTVDELKSHLSANTAFVDFLEYTHITPAAMPGGVPTRESRVVAFVTRSKGGTVRRELASAAAIDKLVSDCREFWIHGKRDEGRDPPADLRKLVWEPLADAITGADTVLVSPDGVMGQVPLTALPGKQADTYLIEDFTIAVVPVPQLLCEAPSSGAIKTAGAAAGMVLLGNVDFESDPGGGAGPRDRSVSAPRGDKLRFSALPGTAVELESLKKLYQTYFKQAPLHDLQRGDATESAFRKQSPGAQFLHLATHGFFAPDQFKPDSASGAGPLSVESDQAQPVGGWNPGLLSGIVLAGANQTVASTQDDGILTAAEVADLNLSAARLVVLSACETGLGQIAGGEGALGLQRAFQIAGARTVVSSLWKVDDSATQLLMTEFYDNLWHKRLPTLAAFREAQLALLRGTVDTSSVRGLVSLDKPADGAKSGRLSPRLWAAFVISGNPD